MYMFCTMVLILYDMNRHIFLMSNLIPLYTRTINFDVINSNKIVCYFNVMEKESPSYMTQYAASEFENSLRRVQI
uniref:Uncharacterized protein n=1 Tax=Pararge aegeria TaxID=116150 RepID=S4NWF0_9NEOP